MILTKIYLYAKDLSGPKYEVLIKKCENAGIKHLNDEKKYLSIVQILWTMLMRILMITSQTKEEKVHFTVFDDTIADIMSSKKNSGCFKRIVY